MACVLFVNACVRGEKSLTQQLARRFLEVYYRTQFMPGAITAPVSRGPGGAGRALERRAAGPAHV